MRNGRTSEHGPALERIQIFLFGFDWKSGKVNQLFFQGSHSCRCAYLPCQYVMNGSVK